MTSSSAGRSVYGVYDAMSLVSVFWGGANRKPALISDLFYQHWPFNPTSLTSQDQKERGLNWVTAAYRKGQER